GRAPVQLAERRCGFRSYRARSPHRARATRRRRPGPVLECAPSDGRYGYGEHDMPGELSAELAQPPLQQEGDGPHEGTEHEALEPRSHDATRHSAWHSSSKPFGTASTGSARSASAATSASA